LSGEACGCLSYLRDLVKISREHVLAEMTRTGKENGDKPLGRYHSPEEGGRDAKEQP
jgi:hypothetical protein